MICFFSNKLPFPDWNISIKLIPGDVLVHSLFWCSIKKSAVLMGIGVTWEDRT